MRRAPPIADVSARRDNPAVASNWPIAAPALLIAAALVLLPGCGNTESVSGRIAGVESDGVLSPRSIEVIDGDGRRWEFEVRDVFGHFTPSHLRQHMLSGERIEVFYSRDGDRLIVRRLEDAP